jgi:hypothetical protein
MRIGNKLQGGFSMGQEVQKQMFKNIWVSILINGVMPILIYNLLLSFYSSTVSLTIAIIIPLLDNLHQVFKYRKADAFGLFMVAGFVLSMLVAFLGGDEKLILMRESIVTGVLGFIFICSLFFSKPLIYYFALRFTANGDPAKKTTYEQRWEIAYFRYVIRLMTAVWGFSLLGEAVIKLILVYQLSVSAFLAVSQIIFYGVLALTIGWTVHFRKHARKRLEQIKNQSM